MSAERQRPLVLCTNDDGAGARGLEALAEALRASADVVVVAPDRERSGASHAITLHHPLRVRERGGETFVVDGTPVDCVYLGVLHLCPRPPALVVSGVNRGYNLGTDVFYSGTVAGAVEGAIRGIPALAVSLDYGEGSYDAAAHFAAAVAASILGGETHLPPHTLLNINVPAGRPAAYRMTRLGRRIYRDAVEVREDPRDLGEDHLVAEELDEVVLGATLHRLHRALHRGVARDDDHGRVEAGLANAVQEREAVHRRHAEVGDHHVPRFLGQELERGDGIADVSHLVALERELVGERDARETVVVDDEDAAVHAAASPASGTRTATVVPVPPVVSTSIVPPWAFTSRFEIARPSPVPLPSGFVVWNG